MDWKNRVALVSLFFCFTIILSGQRAADHQRIEGELIVQLQTDVAVGNFLQQLNQNKVYGGPLQLKKTLSKTHNIQLLSFDPTAIDFNLLLNNFRRMPQVMAVQPNYTIAPRTTPNDPEYTAQWDMDMMQAPAVWDITTGGLTANGDTIVVAIVDSGFDETHEDLAPNLWRNPGEIPGDGIDNDNNQFIDDVNGWSFKNNSGDLAFDSHGTSVAGIVGAKGNNGIGVTGVNWNIKLLLIDIGNVGHAIEAYEYVIDQRSRYNASNGEEGAFVVATNASFGQRQRFCEDQPVWGGMYDLMGEVGILTGAGTANSAYDVEEVGDMPTTCPSDYIITVLNTTMDDHRYQGSAYGNISIDMGSPGEDSYTITGLDRYGIFGGNSAAAPHLTGAIALLYSLPCPDLANEALTRPSETALRIREALIGGVDSVDGLSSITVTGGRLNVFKSMVQLQDFCGSSTGPIAIQRISPNPVRSTLMVEYETPDFQMMPIRVYNALGQVVLQREELPPRFGTKRFFLDTNHLAPGAYFLQIGRAGQYQVETFIKH